jgi:hypothetical protein
VEKEKIKMHFSWFKKNNHLYKDITLHSDLIDDFFSDSIQATAEFEASTKGDALLYQSDEEDEEEIPKDVCETFFKVDQNAPHEPLKATETDWTHNQTTMFLNKYSENTNIASVANKFADIIVDYETNQQIIIENEDDFEIDYEIIPEDEFLRNVEQELDIEYSNQHQEQEDRGKINLSCSTSGYYNIEDLFKTFRTHIHKLMMKLLVI